MRGLLNPIRHEGHNVPYGFIFAIVPDSKE
jgi:hypothetical protein